MSKKLILGLGILAVASYLLWKSKKKSFTSYSNPNIVGVPTIII